MTYAAESPLIDAGTNDDLSDEFLGALTALGGSAGNGRLRETLEWDEASDDMVRAPAASQQVV